MGMSKYYVRSGLRYIDYECILFLLFTDFKLKLNGFSKRFATKAALVNQ